MSEQTVTSQWTGLREAHQILETFSDPYTGIVHRKYEKLNDVDDIRGYSFGSHCTDSRHLIGAASNIFNGGGASGRLAARLAAIGEAVERYSAAYLPTGFPQLTRATSSELLRQGKQFWTPESLELFTAEQYQNPAFRYRQVTPDQDILWHRGVNTSTGEPLYFPAQLLYFRAHWKDEPPLGYTTSNGLACGIQPVEAQIGGLFEAIERDAFMLTWYDMLSLPLIDFSSSATLNTLVQRRIHPTGLRVSLIDMSGFCGIPTILCLVRNPHSTVAPLALGAASAATAERAAEKAIFESMHTRAWIKSEQRAGNALYNANWDRDIHSFEDHIRLYADPTVIHYADFLDASEHRIPLESLPRFTSEGPQELWEALLTTLARQNLEVGVFDLTSPDVAEGGVSVQRVIVRGLLQLDAPYNARMFGGERVLNHAYRLGLLKRPLRREELNPAPHPFP